MKIGQNFNLQVINVLLQHIKVVVGIISKVKLLNIFGKISSPFHIQYTRYKLHETFSLKDTVIAG